MPKTRMPLTLPIAFVFALTWVVFCFAQTPDEMIFSAKNYMSQGKYREAEVLLKKTFDLQRYDRASEKELADTISLLIKVYEKQGKKQEADQLNEWAAKMWASFDGKSRGHGVTVFDAPIQEPTQGEEKKTDQPGEKTEERAVSTLYEYLHGRGSTKSLMDQYLDQLPINLFSRWYSVLILLLLLQIGVLLFLVVKDSVFELIRDACFDFWNWCGKIWRWFGEREGEG